jgi:hypothetical protein
MSGKTTPTSTPSASSSSAAAVSPWLDVEDAALRARVGPKLIYAEVKAGRLKAAKIGGRRELRFLADWVDAWLIEASKAPTPKAA